MTPQWSDPDLIAAGREAAAKREQRRAETADVLVMVDAGDCDGEEAIDAIERIWS